MEGTPNFWKAPKVWFVAISAQKVEDPCVKSPHRKTLGSGAGPRSSEFRVNSSEQIKRGRLGLRLETSILECV